MTREEAIRWLKVINTKEFGWDDFALQESQREIRERCEQGVREAIDMAIEALSAEEAVWNEYEAEFTDLPDVPRYYYEKVVGKMAHEINMLREQLESADAVSRYEEWLEKIIVDNEGANEWLCEDTPDLEWCEKNCHYSSIQAECLRHLYEVSKGGDEE